jgi:hypothetical protein
LGLLTINNNASLLQEIQVANCFALLVGARRWQRASEKILPCRGKRIQALVFNVQVAQALNVGFSLSFVISRGNSECPKRGDTFLD